ncbi:protein-tyrosine phosphatase-like protein [Plectosphaerella plurivora]|uniref:Protein-tyrosine phosphatase-like protein n=1 Tax=Plectosphaerella plurivora TaxID=936078 RepID=A0A9P8VEV9_9PEZI|nr:protein-tyrosine phosphatase-like protein [Plectosphaerella plurivora]
MAVPGSVDGIESVANLRDAGKTVNEFLGKRLVKEGLLYRSARPGDATPEDQEKLKSTLGIRTIIDLRTKTEQLKQSQDHDAANAAPAALQTNADAVRPLEIPGVKYRLVNLTGRGLQQHLVSKLGWLSYFRVVFYMILGWRVTAVEVVAREVMRPRGLIGFTMDMIDYSGPEIATALRTYIEPGGVPSIVHCTQGKDRTGLIVALILLTLKVPVAAIKHDYIASEEGLAQFANTRLKEIARIGLTEAWGKTDPKLISALDEHLNKAHGGIDGYLDSIGFTAEERVALRELLLY